MKVAIIPVTPFRQNSSLLICKRTKKGAIVDPGGDLGLIYKAVKNQGVELGKIFLTQTRSVQYYRGIKDPQVELRARMRELAHSRVRYGYRRVHVLLRREGWSVGRNRAYRLYCEEGLQLRSKLPQAPQDGRCAP